MFETKVDIKKWNKQVEMMLTTWKFSKEDGPLHPLLKLAGEAGELLDSFAKGQWKPNYDFAESAIEENGDLTFYIRCISWHIDRAPEVVILGDLPDYYDLLDVLLLLQEKANRLAKLYKTKHYVDHSLFDQIFSLVLLVCDDLGITWNQQVEFNYERLTATPDFNQWNTPDDDDVVQMRFID